MSDGFWARRRGAVGGEQSERGSDGGSQRKRAVRPLHRWQCLSAPDISAMLPRPSRMGTLGSTPRRSSIGWLRRTSFQVYRNILLHFVSGCSGQPNCLFYNKASYIFVYGTLLCSLDSNLYRLLPKKNQEAVQYPWY